MRRRGKGFHLDGSSFRHIVFCMSVEDIKKGLVSLSEAEQKQVTAFLFHLRHMNAPQDAVADRLSDTDPSHWVSPEDFEKQLDRR